MVSFSTGYFATTKRSTQRSKVHICMNGKPVCGSKFTTDSEYLWCASGIVRQYVECKRCKQWAYMNIGVSNAKK